MNNSTYDAPVTILILIIMLTAGKAHNVHVHVRARYREKEKYEIVGSCRVGGHTLGRYKKTRSMNCRLMSGRREHVG